MPSDARPLVVGYHMQPSALASLGNAVEVRTTVAKEGALYTGWQNGVVKPLGKTGRPTVLIGWSAGAQAVRSHIEHGDLEDVVAVIELDGAHANKVPQEARLAPWRSLLSSSLARPALVMTSTRIDPVTYASTRAVLGALKLPTDDGVWDFDGGRVRIVNSPGKDAAEHVKHLHHGASEVARVLGLPAVKSPLDHLERHDDGSGGPSKFLWLLPFGAALYFAWEKWVK